MRRPLSYLVVVLAALSLGAGCRPADRPPAERSSAESASGAGTPSRGGQIVIAVRTEPQTFNRFTRRDAATDLISTLINAKLTRINRLTQDVEPWLAERWTRAEDGRHYTLTLRDGVRFSDGHPFTADDVLFSLEALYDARSDNVLAEAMKIGGKPLKATAPDVRTVVLEFPEPFAPGLRLLDNLPIIPKHKLEPALRAGTFAAAWGVGTPVAEIAGLGPFVLAAYVPGQRTELVRNRHYFRTDERGTALPYLDRIVVEIVPDQNGELLRLEAGELDLTFSEIRPDDYAPLRRAADAGRVRLYDLGVGLDADSFWINLKPGAFAGDPRSAWLQRDELRRAISLAVNRQQFADTVYLGAAVPVFGPITPANRKWWSPAVPQTPHDPAQARQLLASLGLTDRNGDGTLEDARGTAVRFTLMTQKGRTLMERAAAVIRDELAKIGVIVDVVLLEGADLIQRFVSGRGYDAVYFSVLTTDTDPAVSQDYWLSRGSGHVWNLQQPTPATQWERQIDLLMDEQMHTADEARRQALFEEVQRIFSEHLPVVHFAAPRVYVVASSHVTHITPAISRPQVLWAPDIIAVRP